ITNNAAITGSGIERVTGISVEGHVHGVNAQINNAQNATISVQASADAAGIALVGTPLQQDYASANVSLSDGAQIMNAGNIDVNAGTGSVFGVMATGVSGSAQITNAGNIGVDVVEGESVGIGMYELSHGAKI